MVQVKAKYSSWSILINPVYSHAYQKQEQTLKKTFLKYLFIMFLTLSISQLITILLLQTMDGNISATQPSNDAVDDFKRRHDVEFQARVNIHMGAKFDK